MGARMKVALGWVLLSLFDELAVFVPVTLFLVWVALITRPMWIYELVQEIYAGKLKRLEAEGAWGEEASDEPEEGDGADEQPTAESDDER